MILRIRSKRHAHVVYKVITGRQLKSGELPCNCPSGFFRKQCWHLREAKRLLEAGVVSVDPETESEAKAV